MNWIYAYLDLRGGSILPLHTLFLSEHTVGQKYMWNDQGSKWSNSSPVKSFRMVEQALDTTMSCTPHPHPPWDEYLCVGKWLLTAYLCISLYFESHLSQDFSCLL